MRVVFFLGFANPFPGAAWTRISYFATHFKSQGHGVAITGVFSPRSDRPARSVWQGIPVINICPVLSVAGVVWKLTNILLAFMSLVPLLLALGPDVVVISVPPGGPAIGAYFASRVAGARILFDYRDPWEDEDLGHHGPGFRRRGLELVKAFAAQLYRRSDRVVSVTGPLAETLISRGVPNVKVVPNGADVKVFTPRDRGSSRARLGLPLQDFILIYSGSIQYYRFDVVLKAFAGLVAKVGSVAKLVLVGEGPDLPLVMTIAKELGVGPAVIYVGVRHEKGELAEVLSAADVGLVPFDDNPLWKMSLPAKFFEYCACGVPVLATVYEDSLLAGMMKELGLGLTVPPLESEQLSEAMWRLCADARGRTAMGFRARAMVLDRFDRRAIAEEFLREITLLLPA